ncbi:OLC1v1009779C1 [Oldenlandia corymbosa var. corymbosa]|uniref:OLC1v1009779C1 n=1 Tax=Oldenlandia corymbosa var. corymbosa TaxID=529605 RepID=A0AAV1DSQ3_OLDCO|nr:OLC1v1009779C1 [Oldenlandia corymbosa var. corymbosa]
MWKCSRRIIAFVSSIGNNDGVISLYGRVGVSTPSLLPAHSSSRALRIDSPVLSVLFPSYFSSIHDGLGPGSLAPISADDDGDDDFGSRGNEEEEDFDQEEDVCNGGGRKTETRLADFRDVETIMGILQKWSNGGKDSVKNRLEQCGVMVSSELVVEVLSRVRNDWETAFTFFLWAGRQPDYEHSLREYHSMISILGKMRKFDTAWGLIEEMRGKSLVTPQTLVIMIRKYCAVHDVGKAISTFYAYKRYSFEINVDEFQNLLSALCRYKNVKDAEHLLFCNKSVFPLSTKSFNIILNGWCNVVGDLREGKRIWEEMRKRGIPRDVFSYSSMLSCYSKVGKLQPLLKLFDQMKALDIAPDRKVYNAVIHALAKARHVKEAWNLMKTMEGNGISPNAITYNSIIMPVCRSRQLDAAREIFNEMMERNLTPNVRTYHAFFGMLRSDEEVFALLQKMKMTSCKPTHDTYIMLIRKFCRWRQFDNVFKLWNEMSANGLDHDRSSYLVLVHGLFLNGKLEESYQYYLEMQGKHMLPDPKIEEMLHAWLAGKQAAAEGQGTNL